MSIPSLSSSSPSAVTSALAGTTSGADTEQRFLKLLVTQLNNQDPLNPMDNAQLTSQLAQLSTVSGIQQMNATLQSLLQQGSTGQMLQAAGMVGHVVLAAGNQVEATGSPTAFGVDLPTAAGSVQAVVKDAAGNTVRTIDLGSMAAGVHTQQWDGLDDAGQAVPAGTYSLQVLATNGAASVNATTLVADRVASISTDSAGALALTLAGGASIGMADVRQVY